MSRDSGRQPGRALPVRRVRATGWVSRL